MSEEAKKPGPPETAPSPEELADLRARAARADEYQERAKRALADFVNYQDRVRREKQEWTREAVERFVREFLPALDSFSMARFEDPELTEALRVIEKEFVRVLAKHGIAPIETSGAAFDPLLHEAVGAEPADGKPDGAILEEVRRGWTIEGRVLRPASVRIVRAARQ